MRMNEVLHCLKEGMLIHNTLICDPACGSGAFCLVP